MTSKTRHPRFGNDLRLADHPALARATASGAPLIPVYVFDDAAPPAPSGASRWWLHHSLAALDAALRKRGSRLILRRGPAVETVCRLAREVGAAHVYLTRHYAPHERKTEAEIAERLAADGIGCHRYGGSLLFEPEVIVTGSGGPYKVFTPFHKACLAAPPPSPPLAAPEIAVPDTWPEGDALADLNLLPTAPDWAGGLRESWTPGEAGANERLDAFLETAMADYGTARDRPDRAGTSRLSPHLRFGEISPRTIWHRARFAAERAGRPEAADGFLRELAGREFSYHLLHHFPRITDEPLRPEFSAFPWRDDN